MTNCFLFAGTPGTHSREMLRILEEMDITPKRIHEDSSLDEIAELNPKAIYLGYDLADFPGYVASLKENRALSQIPIIAIRPESFGKNIEKAFRAGIDDYVVDGNLRQFKAQSSVITDNLALDTIRAASGLAVLGHPDRFIRMRIGQVLRKNGWDIHFAASRDELIRTIEDKKPRIVLVAQEMPDGMPLGMVNSLSHKAPWVVITDAEKQELLEVAVGDNDGIRFFDSDSDFESIVFIMNNLLAPEQVSERRTPRILYNTPALFAMEDGEVSKPFHGFTYNVNIGGIFIRTLTPPPMQSEIIVKFCPPHGCGQVCYRAQVVWIKKMTAGEGPSSPPGIGVQFTDVLPADRAGYETGYNLLREEYEHKRIAFSSNAPGVPTS